MISGATNHLMGKLGPMQYAERIAYSSKEVLKFTYDMAVKYRDSPGVYVECGVAAGAQIIAMAAGAPDKTIYAFDSFEGIPMPSNRDDQYPGIRMIDKEEQDILPNPGQAALVSSGATVVSMYDFGLHIDRSGVNHKNITVIPGWFEETVKDFNEPIAILRLDGDLYNSTYVCLKYLYPLVIKGGLVIIDDYALSGCAQAVIDYFDGIESSSFQVWTVGDSQLAYWTK